MQVYGRAAGIDEYIAGAGKASLLQYFNLVFDDFVEAGFFDENWRVPSVVSPR